MSGYDHTVHSETSEQQHEHLCPDCGDSWLHADDECQAPVGELPMIWVPRTWARCPMHEQESR